MAYGNVMTRPNSSNRKKNMETADAGVFNQPILGDLKPQGIENALGIKSLAVRISGYQPFRCRQLVMKLYYFFVKKSIAFF